MFGKKKLTFRGCDHDQLYARLCKLYDLQDDIILTDAERDAVEIGVLALRNVMWAMNHNGRVKFDDFR
jgi:hypothetical protein